MRHCRARTRDVVMRSIGGMLMAAGLLLASERSLAAAEWRAGAAKVVITPTESMWMSGYGGRDHESEGKLHDLWAKALVIEDPHGEKLVLVTLDLVGIDRALSTAVCDALCEKHKLERRQIALFTSHTHTGPVVGTNLGSMYFLTDAQHAKVVKYTADLQARITGVVSDAFEDLGPAQLTYGTGHTTFGVNRRANKEAEVPQLRADGLLKGPVDHDVPVLAVKRPDGALRAVVCGYACHATVLSFYQFSGDWPGFAQIEIEQEHPGTIALFFAGCGADQNPLPRRTVEYAQEYGQMLAAAVDRVLIGKMAPVEGALQSAYREIDLPFATLPTRAELEIAAKSTDRFVAKRAELLLAQIDGGRPLSPTYPYPVQWWRLGADLQLVTLGGEVVVDYSLRVKKELGPGSVWVAAYANDVMAYIPSERVLKEGGYEGAGAMVYYGLPSPWAEGVEEQIVRAILELRKAEVSGEK